MQAAIIGIRPLSFTIQELTMFLAKLSPKQKEAFYSLANQFIRIDGKVLRSEKLIIKQLKTEMGLSAADKPKNLSISEACRPFKSTKSRVSAILEMIGIGLADSDYSKEETAFVNEMARNFGFDEIKLLEMENWALRMLTLSKEAAEFMKEED